MAENRRLSDAEKQRLAEERRAQNAAEVRQAELEYAEDYRKKLRRDRKRAEAAARAEREARETAVREARAKEISEQLEADRREAAAREERSRALLEKVIASREASAREDFSIPEQADEEAVSPEASELPNEEETAQDAPEEESEIEAAASDEGEKFLLDICDDRILLSITEDGAVVGGADHMTSGVRIHEITPAERLEREGTALSVKQNITVSTEDTEEEEKVNNEEIIDAVNPEYDDPIKTNYPEVAAIKLLGRSVTAKSAFRKYINESKSVIKSFNRRIAGCEGVMLSENISLDKRASTLIDIIGAVGAIVEIRCDNLRIVAKFGQRRYIPEIKKALSAEISRYNDKAYEFLSATGERLTLLSPELVNRISDGTGAEVIPLFTYNEKYIEVTDADGRAAGVTFALNINGLDNSPMPEIVPLKTETAEHIYSVTPIYPSLSASELLRGENVTSRASYKDYLKRADRAQRRIDSEISSLRSGIIRAEQKRDDLDKKLSKRRAVLDNMLSTMDHGAEPMLGRRDKDLEALDREAEKCENIERELELKRTYIENESKKTDIVIGCLSLEREKLLIAFNTLASANATSSDKLILRAKNALLSEMARYNSTVDECSMYVDMELTPITSELAEAVLSGKSDIKIPQIALLRELVENVGDEKRVIGGRDARKAQSAYTLNVNAGAASQGSGRKSSGNTPIRTMHGHFFMGGAAPGNIVGGSFAESDIALAAVMSGNPNTEVCENADASFALGASAAVLYHANEEEPNAEKAAVIAEEKTEEANVRKEAAAAISETEKEQPKASPVEKTEAESAKPEGITAVDEAALLAESTANDEPSSTPSSAAEEADASAEGTAEELEAPISESSPRKVRRRVVDELGDENIIEEPCPEKLVDDEIGSNTQPIIYEDLGEEAAAAPENDRAAIREPELDSFAADEEPKKKKIKLRQLPPPEKSETANEELRPITDDEPIFPGNVINKDYIDEDDFDPKDSTKIPSVIEVDDSADDAENDVLFKPTRRGLKKHLRYINRKIRKAARERRRLISQKKKAEGVASKARILISILGVQKKIADWHANAETSCCDLGEMRRAKRIAGILRSELKRYNRYVKEYEKLTGDRLTEASLETPELILEGEDYQVIPRIKIREFTAPEEGVVYGDGVTESADYADEIPDNVVITEKVLNKMLSEDSRKISKLHGELEDKVKEKHNAWGIDKTIYTVECFGIQKKIIDTLAGDLRAACQVSSVKNIQSLKRDISAEVKQYNRLVSEYKTVSGNDLTRASDSIAQDIISGNLYIPIPRVGCIYMNEDQDLDGEIRAMSRNSYGVEDASYGIGGVAFRTKVTSQANKDLALMTKRADYQVSMLESERDMLIYGYGKESGEVKKKKREIAKRISSIRASHKEALKYESNDNRRYYAVVTANPYTMELKNKRADRTRVAAIRSKIIDLLNERDIVNGKLSALYTGSRGGVSMGSINQEWRKVKNKAALKSKKKQKRLADVVKNLPITSSEKAKVYNLINEKINTESTVAMLKKRLRKEKLHSEDKLCARRDIKAQQARVKAIDKEIYAHLRSIDSRISDIQATSSWYSAFLFTLLVAAVGIILYIYYIGPYISSLFA